MGKKKTSKDQPLFIQFANCKFTKNDILGFLSKTIKKYCPYEAVVSEILNIIEDLRADKKTLKYFEPIDQFFSEAIKPLYESFLNNDFYTDSNNSIFDEESITDYLFRSAKDDEEWDAIGKDLSDDCVLFIYVAFYQLRLKDVLKKVISHKRIERILLEEMTRPYGSHITKLNFGKNTYLEAEKTEFNFPLFADPSYEDAEVNLFSIFDDIFIHDLIKFLCTPDWKKLKQCGECERFFVAKVKRDDIKFCSKKCKQDNWNREYTKSGKHAEYMKRKRPEKPEWIT
jgi:hypothetical protein